ncbi:MAG: hypothetical protein V1816_22300 [Pseudomonadota bacterium]
MTPGPGPDQVFLQFQAALVRFPQQFIKASPADMPPTVFLGQGRQQILDGNESFLVRDQSELIRPPPQDIGQKTPQGFALLLDFLLGRHDQSFSHMDLIFFRLLFR